MTATSDFFDKEAIAAPTGTSVPWRFVTNNMNLQFMLAAGMIMPPDGFMNKYYKDTLSDFPGFIPLFLDRVPKAAIEAAVSERSHLIPCIANLHLGGLQGPVHALDREGKLHEVSFPDVPIANLYCLLVPAPLPINWIKEILFASRDHKTRFEQGSRDFNNVSLADFPRKASASNFNKASADTWPPANVAPKELQTALAAPLAAGAMMAVLFHLGRRSDAGIRAVKRAFEPHAATEDERIHPILAAINQWMELGRTPAINDASARLFWGLVDKLTENNLSPNKNQPLDIALMYLESESDQHGNDRARQAGEKLVSDLRGLVGFSDKTVSEVLEQHPKPSARALILFFLREKLSELLDFENPELNEQDYLAAAILFAARQGWMGVSNDLRDPPELRTAISHRMAVMAHRLAKTGIDLGAAPPRPLSLNELFSQPNGWSKKQKEAAVELAKGCKWDCLQTRITLGKGDYKLSVDGSGMSLIIDGLAKAISEEIRVPEFVDLLNREAVPQTLEQHVREKLKS